MNLDCIVAASHLRFDGVWQRPHHILTRLAKRLPVLWVEEPLLSHVESDALEAHGGVDVLRPKRRTRDELVDARTLAAVRTWLGSRRPLLWFYQPMMLALAEAFPDAPVAFDCMDDLSAFDFAPPELLERERVLCRRSTLVFAGGRTLFERMAWLGEKARRFPSGVEFEHFALAASLPRPPLLAALAPPICGYIGVIDERIDFALVRALAARGASVVLVGPVVKVDAANLPRDRNVHFSGLFPYDALPELLAGFDVALMPFARNRATHSISPTKTPEYLAAQRPVVSTSVADVVADYGDVVRVADGPEAFADAAFEVAARPDPARVARGVALAREAGWDPLVTRMWNALESELRTRCDA